MKLCKPSHCNVYWLYSLVKYAVTITIKRYCWFCGLINKGTGNQRNNEHPYEYSGFAIGFKRAIHGASSALLLVLYFRIDFILRVCVGVFIVREPFRVDLPR